MSHVRIGERSYRLAEQQGRELLGLPGMRRLWNSVNATQGSVIGSPGLENPTEEDLRWILTSFAAGEGQKVLNAEDELSAQRYDRSNGIDLATFPGSIVLQKQMRPEGLSTGIGTTTREASTFSDITGTSNVSGTDRELTATNNEIGKSEALLAGQHLVEFYAYSEPKRAAVEGSTFTATKGKGTVSGSDLLLQMPGEPWAAAKSAVRTGLEGEFDIWFVLKGNRTPNENARCSVLCEVKEGDRIHTSARIQLRAVDGQYDNLAFVRLRIWTQSFRSMHYRVKLENQDGAGARGVYIDRVEEHYLGRSVFQGRVMDGSTEIAQWTWDITGSETSVKVGLPFSLATNTTVSFRFKRISGSADIWADKIVYTDSATLRDGAVAELGKGGDIWLADYDASAPVSIFKWVPSTRLWTFVANVGGNGARCRALCHSDAYEYAAVDDDKVYRLDGGSTQYTNAVGSLAGITVAADRLWLLSESGGVKLYRASVDSTSGLPITPTLVATPVTAEPAHDFSLVQRMCAGPAGPIWFVNQSTECVIYEWNEGTQTWRVVARISGFKARAIAHGQDLTFIAGEHPNPAGGTKAALFVVDHMVGPGEKEQVRLPFEREDDPDSYMQALQVYGDQVYVVDHLSSSPPRMRMWRVSMAQPGGLFHEHEVELPAGKVAKAIAITDQTRMMIADTGGPYVAQGDYIPGGEAYLRSSLYHFKLLDNKRLIRVMVDGEFPSGTSCEIRFSLDGGVTWNSAGIWTEAESKLVPTTLQDLPFRNLMVEIRPVTASVLITPRIYSVEVVAAVAASGSNDGRVRRFEMILDCTNSTASRRLPEDQDKGFDRADYIFSLVGTGELVDMEDSYFDPSGASRIVELKDPQWYSVAQGEGLLRLVAIER